MLLDILIIVTVLAIWIHSAMPASVSSRESSSVMNFIRPVLELFVGRGNVSEHLVRKLAHFTEYFVLGVELSFRKKKKFLNGLIIAFVVAFLDETIQIFSAGRSAQITDVWLDMSGVLTASLLCKLLCLGKRNQRVPRHIKSGA